MAESYKIDKGKTASGWLIDGPIRDQYLWQQAMTESYNIQQIKGKTASGWLIDGPIRDQQLWQQAMTQSYDIGNREDCLWLADRWANKRLVFMGESNDLVV